MAILWDAEVAPNVLTHYARQVEMPEQYQLGKLFPAATTSRSWIDLDDITTYARAAKFRAYDAAPQPGRRDGFARRRVTLPPVTHSLSEGEYDALRQADLAGGGASDIVDALYSDTDTCVTAVQMRVELARGELVTTGRITLPEIGPGVAFDFGVPGGHIVTAATSWEDTGADILADLRAWVETYRAANGFTPGGMVASSRVVLALMKSPSIGSLAYPVAATRPPVMALEGVNAALSSVGLPPVVMQYQATVKVDEISTDIIPSDRIVFVPPSGRLGRTVWGVSAQLRELAASGMYPDLQGPGGIAAFVDKGAAVPFRRAVYADAVVLPVLDSPRTLFVATVA